MDKCGTVSNNIQLSFIGDTTGARHLMVVGLYRAISPGLYHIYDSLLTHAFLWRYYFRAIILAPSVVSYRLSVCGETKDGAKIMARKL